MKILAVNAGSSSMKFQLFLMPEERLLVSSNFERIGSNESIYSIIINDRKITKETPINNHKDAVYIFLKELIDNKIILNLDEIKAVGHRIVHGADKYNKPVIINDLVIADIRKYISLAPLHNPAGIIGVEEIISSLPHTINIAVFDTSFHQTMEPESFIYPIPYEWYTNYGVRRYGFHGISHEYITNRLSEIIGSKSFKVIICHLGNGSSITAVKDGKSVETSMGFTPLAGIPMGTRCGDIDSSIIEYMMKEKNVDINNIMTDLNKKSGLIGISGISNDARDIEDAILRGEPRAILTYNIFGRKIASYIASYNCLLDGTDAIVFTGGLGANSQMIRANVIQMISALGVKIDESKNNVRGIEQKISDSTSTIDCYVIPTNEELLIVRETYDLIK